MIDAGFFVKQIRSTPAGMDLPGVREICSVSQCISPGPEHWIELWLHNDWGWFNRVADALRAIPSGQQSTYRLFAYRMHPEVITAAGRMPLVVPGNVRPVPISGDFRSLGFDSVSRSMETSLGLDCSPLSCNSMARQLHVNACCLFHSLETALAGATRFAIEQPEPGDYYVVEVLEADFRTNGRPAITKTTVAASVVSI